MPDTKWTMSDQAAVFAEVEVRGVQIWAKTYQRFENDLNNCRVQIRLYSGPESSHYRWYQENLKRFAVFHGCGVSRQVELVGDGPEYIVAVPAECVEKFGSPLMIGITANNYDAWSTWPEKEYETTIDEDGRSVYTHNEHYQRDGFGISTMVRINSMAASLGVIRWGHNDFYENKYDQEDEW